MLSSYPLPTGILLIYRTLRFALLAFVLVFLLSSCSKTEQSTHDSGIHDPKYDMYYKILTFIQTMEGKELTHPTISPRTLYSPNDVLNYIEGGMNLMFADATLTWDGYDVAIDTFAIPLSAGYASEQDLEELFEEIRDSASVHFYSIAEPDRFPNLYDASTVSVNSSLMTLRVTSRVGTVHRNPTPFGPTDYWSIFDNEGKCDPESGGSGNASDRLNEALDDYFTPYSCTFYTDITTVFAQEMVENYNWWGENENDPTPGDFVIDYRTLNTICETGTSECTDFVENGVYCLDPDEMNYYCQSIISIFNDYTYDTGLENCFAFLSIDYSGLGGTTHYWWDCRLQFGTPNACDEQITYPIALPYCCP